MTAIFFFLQKNSFFSSNQPKNRQLLLGHRVAIELTAVWEFPKWLLRLCEHDNQSVYIIKISTSFFNGWHSFFVFIFDYLAIRFVRKGRFAVNIQGQMIVVIKMFITFSSQRYFNNFVSIQKKKKKKYELQISLKIQGINAALFQILLFDTKTFQ